MPCSSNLRLLQTDSSYITLGDIYDKYCEDTGIEREDPSLLMAENHKAALLEAYRAGRQVCTATVGQSHKTHYGIQLEGHEAVALRKDTMDEVTSKMIPTNIISGVSTSRSSNGQLLTHPPVYDGNHGQSRRFVAYAQAVHIADRVRLFCYPCAVPHRPSAVSLPPFTYDRSHLRV